MKLNRSRIVAGFGAGLFLVAGWGGFAPLLASAPPPPVIQPPAAQDNGPQDNSLGQPPASDSTVPAPVISDDQQIQNIMDMALSQFHAEDYQACIRTTDDLLNRYPYPQKNLYWVVYLGALSQEHLDRYAEAVKEYHLVIKRAPHTTYANAATFRMGLCQLKEGDTNEAMFTLRDIIENNPYSEYRLQAYVHLGNLYRHVKQWRLAERVYKDIIRFYPDTDWAWNSAIYLAQIHAHLDEDTVAINIYRQLLRDPKVPAILQAQAQLAIGDLYLSDKMWLEALQTYRYALRDFSDVPGVVGTCDEKIQLATEGRRTNHISYREVDTPARAVVDQPADEDYLMRQESVPNP